LDVAIKNKGHPVRLYGAISLVAYSIIQRNYKRTHTHTTRSTIRHSERLTNERNVAYIRNFLHQLYALPASNRFGYESFMTALF